MNTLILYFFFGLLSGTKVEKYDVLSSSGDRVLPTQVMKNIPGCPGDLVTVVNDKFRPLKEPKNSSGPSGAPPVVFGDYFNVLDKHQANNTTFWLVSKNDAKDVYGWIPDEFVLPNRNALKLQGSNIIRKALIINSKEWMIKNNFTPPLPQRGFLENSDKSIPAKFFNIMFIYKDIKINNSNYFLLGYSPSVANIDNIPENIAGWFPAESICQWNTREAVQWNDSNFGKSIGGKSGRAFPGLVFRTKEYLIEEIKKGPRKDNSNYKKEQIIAEEIIDETGKSKEWSKDQVRYPVLSFNKEDIFPGYGKIMKIGVVGNFANNDGTFVDNEAVDAIRDKVDEIKEQMKKTFLLFIVDDTSSMEKAYQENLPKFLENIMKNIPKEGKDDVKVAICFYNDFKSPKDKLAVGANLDQTIKYSDWKILESDVIKDLKNHNPSDGGDALEQPIHGIKRGLENAIKTKIPKYARKIVFVIGDMGNHEKDNLNQNIEEDSEHIAKMLNPFGASPWEFFPIQVPHPRDAEAARTDSDYLLFAKQMKNILQLSSQKRKQNLSSLKTDEFKEQIQDLNLANPITVSDYDSLSNMLEQRAKEYEKKLTTILSEIMSVQRGTFIAGTKFSPEVALAFSNEGVNIEVLKKTGSQIFEEGWITEFEGTKYDLKQIKNMIFMEETLFDNIYFLLKNIIEFQNQNAIDNLFLKIAAGQVGQFFQNINDAKNAFESVSFKSKIIELIVKLNGNPVGQANNIIQDPGAVYIDLELIYNLYEDIKLGRFREYKLEDTINKAGNKVKKWVPKVITDKNDNKNSDGIKKERFFYLKGTEKVGGTRWIWLDYDKEFP